MSGEIRSVAPSRVSADSVQMTADALRNGPELWNAILEPIRAAYGSAVIAGGAVRDYLIGVEPRDIDVFVAVRDREHLVQAAADLGPKFDVSLMTFEDASEYEAGQWVSEVRGVMDGLFVAPTARPVLVQIVGCALPEIDGAKLVESFDLAITRCWFDGELHDTPEAKADRDANTMTLRICESYERMQRSYLRFERVNTRLDHKFRIIEDFPPFLTSIPLSFAQEDGATPQTPQPQQVPS